MVNTKTFSVFLAVLCIGWTALKADNLYVVGRNTPIYEEPDREFATGRQFTRGQNVSVDDTCPEGFCRAKAGGETGYVLRSALVDWQLVGSTGAKPKKWHWRADIIETYLQQSQHSIQTSLNSQYNLSTFKGQNTNFGFGFEYAKDLNWCWLAGLIYRQSDVEGDSVEAGTTLTNRFRLEETFIGVTAGLRYQLSHWDRWSLQGNLEYSMGQSIKLVVVSGPPIDSSGLAKPTYFIISGGVNYDWPLAPRSSIEFGLRGGGVMTTTPQTILAEAMTSFRYSF